MDIRLSLLDRKNVVFSTNRVDVYVYDTNYRYIGTCELYKDGDGNTRGILLLEEQISPEYYVYYRGRSIGGVYHFHGLEFYEQEVDDQPSVKLKSVMQPSQDQDES